MEPNNYEFKSRCWTSAIREYKRKYKKKRWIGNNYNKFLKKIKNFTLPLIKTDYADNIYWVYSIILKKNIKMSANNLIKILNNKGIGARNFFCPLHLQPILKKMGYFKNEKYPVSESLYKKGLYIPSGLNLNLRQIKKISEFLTELDNKISKIKK